jgi:hypothetical protein
MAVLAVSAPALAACGGDDDEAQRAVNSVNGGSVPITLREFVEARGKVSSCRLASRQGYPGQMTLTVVTESDHWLHATIDPDQTLLGQDVTTGGGFDSQTAAGLASRGDACRISPADGSLSLIP